MPRIEYETSLQGSTSTTTPSPSAHIEDGAAGPSRTWAQHLSGASESKPAREPQYAHVPQPALEPQPAHESQNACMVADAPAAPRGFPMRLPRTTGRNRGRGGRGRKAPTAEHRPPIYREQRPDVPTFGGYGMATNPLPSFQIPGASPTLATYSQLGQAPPAPSPFGSQPPSDTERMASEFQMFKTFLQFQRK